MAFTFSNPFSALTDIFGADDDDFNTKNIYKFARDLGLISEEPGTATSTEPSKTDYWKIRALDWYKVFPYQFVIIGPADLLDDDMSSDDALAYASGTTPLDDQFYYTLPIPPQSMTTKLIPASQVTPTIGGVVEETSSNVFWIINLTGTTGTAIGRTKDNRKAAMGSDEMADKFRARKQTTGALAGTFSNISQTIGKLSSVINVLGQIPGFTPDGFETDDVNPIDAVSSIIQGVSLPPSSVNSSGVGRKSNGFSEINEMHRFLHVYSRIKEANPSTYFLKFRNNKMNQEWYCSLQDFSIQQSAVNPLLYKYNIQLKCWNISSISEADRAKSYDRFGPNGDLKSVNVVSLREAVNGIGNIGKQINAKKKK